MTVAWNVRFAANQVQLILYPLAALLWRHNRVNKSTARCFYVLAIMDTIMYFWNYKTTDYGYIYFWYVGFFLIIHFGKNIAAWLWSRLPKPK